MGGGRRFSVGGGAFEESRPEGEEERPKGTGFIMDSAFNELSSDVLIFVLWGHPMKVLCVCLRPLDATQWTKTIVW